MQDNAKITLEQLFCILILQNNDEMIVYDNEDYAEYIRNENTGLNEVNYYHPGIFTLKPSMFKLSAYLNPKYALATVMYCEHCEDGKFRVVINPEENND